MECFTPCINQIQYHINFSCTLTVCNSNKLIDLSLSLTHSIKIGIMGRIRSCVFFSRIFKNVEKIKELWILHQILNFCKLTFLDFPSNLACKWIQTSRHIDLWEDGLSMEGPDLATLLLDIILCHPVGLLPATKVTSQ